MLPHPHPPQRPSSGAGVPPASPPGVPPGGLRTEWHNILSINMLHLAIRGFSFLLSAFQTPVQSSMFDVRCSGPSSEGVRKATEAYRRVRKATEGYTFSSLRQLGRGGFEE